MVYKYDAVLKNGFVIDPVTKLNGIMDIGIKEGKIAEIAPAIGTASALESFDLTGLHVIPGIVDIHTHVSAWLGGKYGHKMLARAGVTSALDMSGPMESVLDIVRDYGVGLNMACIEYIRPGHTVKTNNPNIGELRTLIDKALSQGALGIKILGGHYPLTPEATASAIKTANDKKAYVAFHAGSLKNGSNIEGFLEAVELVNGNCVHLAHINSYCRGRIEDPLTEAQKALKVLKKHPNIRSEAYLSPLNGTSAKCSDGIPESLVTHDCLQTGGFAATEKGLEEAILAGWAQINAETGNGVILITGREGIDYWRSQETDTTVSFAVNPAVPRYCLTTAKKADGQFVVDCISTDGGGIPRNVIIEMGLSLVKLQALTIEEFVLKASTNPAKILGLVNKGHLRIGADADITVFNFARQKPFMAIANGQIIMYNGYVCGCGGKIITTPIGAKTIEQQGLNALVVDLPSSGLYKWHNKEDNGG